MRGHIRKRGGSYSVVVDNGYDPDTGKRRQKWIAVKGNKRDAERKLAEVINDLNAGAFVGPSRLTPSEYLQQWLQDYVAVSVRPRTAEGYRGIVGHLEEGLGKVNLSKLNARQIQRYYSSMLEKGYSAQTVHHHHRVLSQGLSQAVEWDMLSQNVATRVTPPKRKKPELKFLTVDEARRLIDAAHGTDYFLPIYLAIHTGLRRSEICGLRWADVDLKAQTIRVVRTMISLKGDRVHISEPKSRNSRRVVAIGEEVVRTLKATRATLRPSRDLLELARIRQTRR